MAPARTAASTAVWSAEPVSVSTGICGTAAAMAPTAASPAGQPSSSTTTTSGALVVTSSSAPGASTVPSSSTPLWASAAAVCGAAPAAVTSTALTVACLTWFIALPRMPLPTRSSGRDAG